jgi:hypothetical protein
LTANLLELRRPGLHIVTLVRDLLWKLAVRFPALKQSRGDNRVAIAGIIVNAVAIIVSAVIGAVTEALLTAHNPQIIKVLR